MFGQFAFLREILEVKLSMSSSERDLIHMT